MPLKSASDGIILIDVSESTFNKERLPSLNSFSRIGKIDGSRMAKRGNT